MGVTRWIALLVLGLGLTALGTAEEKNGDSQSPEAKALQELENRNAVLEEQLKLVNNQRIWPKP